MSDSNNHIGQIIEKILWGKSFVTISSTDSYSDCKPSTFILRSLTIKESNWANYIYNRELNLALQAGVLSFDDLLSIYKSADIWTDSTEEEIKNLEKREKILQSEIKDFQFITIKKKKAEKELEVTRKSIKNIRDVKNNIFSLSAESRAEEVMRRYLVMMSTENIKEKSYWLTEEDFLKETNIDLIYHLAIEYYKNNIFNESILRKIARSPEWRVKWNASKNGANLFGRPIPEWSDMQNWLVYWSQFYDFIYDSYERPSDVIIDDDNSCDSWVRDQNKKIKNSSQSKDKNLFGNKRAITKQDHQEQFVMVQKDDSEVIKQVQEMNSEDVRIQLRGERKTIVEQGRMSEWKLRGKNYVGT